MLGERKPRLCAGFWSPRAEPASAIILPVSTRDRGALPWLPEFEAACRGRDSDAGRVMFAPFGTWASAAHGLDSIEQEQWRRVSAGP
jgi:hypothetical protein